MAASLLVAVVGPMLAKDPYPLVNDSVFESAVLDALPRAPSRGFISMSPEIGGTRQVVGEAIALLEVNLLVRRWGGSDSTRLTRRGQAAITSGDVLGAMTVAR